MMKKKIFYRTIVYEQNQSGFDLFAGGKFQVNWFWTW